MKQVLMILGSLRQNGLNRQLANHVRDKIGARAQVHFLDYADIPFMNQDIEFPAPQSIARVRSEVKKADAIWIFTPEYNGQIPGVLKNLLDWLSRPVTPSGSRQESAAAGKIVTISAAAGRSAGMGVRKQLYPLLKVMSMHVVGDMGTGIALGGEAFSAGTLTLSEQDESALDAQIDLLLK